MESLFDIAKPDIEYKLCEMDKLFIQDQRMKRQATFGMTDTKLLARLERKGLHQNKKKRKEKAQKEKETLAMVPVPVADDYDRDQSVYEEIDENFCEPPAKQSKNSDHILLYVPQNIASISQVSNGCRSKQDFKKCSE